MDRGSEEFEVLSGVELEFAVESQLKQNKAQYCI